MPQDWNNGTGCRFYDPMLTQKGAIGRLLMFGYESTAKADIPMGGVFGNDRNEGGVLGVMNVGRSGMLLFPPRSY